MASTLRTLVEKTLPKSLSKKIVAFGQAYKRTIRNKERIKKYGGDKPFTYHVNTEGVSFDIVLDPVHNCVVDAEIKEYGCWEKEMGNVFKKYIQKGDTVLDIGANIGYHSLYCAALLNNTGKVYSFEPIPRLAKQLESSVKINNFSNIQICNFGLAESDQDKKVLYLRDENIGGSSLFRYENIELVKVMGTTEVALKKLDNFLPHEKVSLIKIDVEGYEYEALRGAHELLSKCHPYILMEYSPIFYTQENDHKALDLVVYLEEIGYSFFSLQDEGLDIRAWLKEGNNVNSQIDILCKVV